MATSPNDGKPSEEDPILGNPSPMLGKPLLLAKRLPTGFSNSPPEKVLLLGYGRMMMMMFDENFDQ